MIRKDYYKKIKGNKFENFKTILVRSYYTNRFSFFFFLNCGTYIFNNCPSNVALNAC